MAYRLKYSDYSTTAEGPPDPAAWVGPPGPQGVPGPVGPQGIPGPDSGGLYYLPLAGGSLTAGANLAVPSVPANTFYLDHAAPHPAVVRLGDRATVAATNAFGLTAGPGTTGYSWAGAVYNVGYLERDATFSAYSNAAGFAIVGAARSSDWKNTGGTKQAYGLAGFSVADAPLSISMGAYLETRLIGLNSVSLGIELEVVNQGAPPPTTNPFLVGANGSATGIMIAAGGDPTQTTGTVYGNAAALAVTGGQNAGAGWQVGMVMGNGSLNVGADGFCRAMDMPALYDIRWTDSSGHVGGSITSAVTSGNVGQRIEFTTGALLVRTADTGATLLSIGQSGVITVPGSISANAVVSDAPAATYHTNAFTTAGSNRWAWGMDNVAESGGAGGYGGGNMFFQSYNNSGAAPVVALQLQRNGQVNIGFCAIAGGSINGTAIGNTSASSGNFTQVQVAATKVLGAQITGWGTPTGPSRIASFPGASATLVQCSSAIAQIIADLKTHGMLGA